MTWLYMTWASKVRRGMAALSACTCLDAYSSAFASGPPRKVPAAFVQRPPWWGALIATRTLPSCSARGWTKHGYAYGDDATTTIGTLRHLDKIERISVKTTTKEEFIERFERTRTPCVITDTICNTDRTAATMMSHHVTKTLGADKQLPDDTITLNLDGWGGQSLGAWMVKGVTLNLVGDAND